MILCVVLLPKVETILERLEKEAMTFKTKKVFKTLDVFYKTAKFGLGRDLPNVLIIEDKEVEKAEIIMQRLQSLEMSKAGDLIKSLVVSSGRNG